MIWGNGDVLLGSWAFATILLSSLREDQAVKRTVAPLEPAGTFGIILMEYTTSGSLITVVY